MRSLGLCTAATGSSHGFRGSSSTPLRYGQSQQLLLLSPRKSSNLALFGRRHDCRWRRRAGLTEIEPDLQEDPIDIWRTNGVDEDDFKYGEYDGHHTYFEGAEPKKGLWDAFFEDILAGEPPGGFQGAIGWLFPPAMMIAAACQVPGEYLYMATAAFLTVYCIIEMEKPDQPHNFEPEIYNMERTARDKLIADYNSMDIWDFNEKYGELWDFTIKRDDIVKS